MLGRLENQIKTERKIKTNLQNMPTYMVDYFNTMTANGTAYKTIQTYIQYINSFLLYVKENGTDIENPESFRSEHVVGFLNSKRYTEDGKSSIKETSGSYRATLHSALSSFFLYLMMSNKIKDNPIKNIKRPSAAHDKVPEVYMTPEEINKTLSLIKEGVGNKCAKSKQKSWYERDMCIMILLVFTGMRVTALTEMNMDSFDFERRVLTVVDKRNKTNEYIITDEMLPYINAWIKKRYELLNYDTTMEAFFISNRRTRITQKSVSRIVEKYSSVIGKHITPHKVRGSYGTNLYKETGNLYLVQELMNHTNANTTARYVHASDENRVKGVEIMSKLISIN